MRLAVFGDVHGNLAALEAVLEDTTQQDIDGMVILGDIVNAGPDSRACWQRVQALGFPLVRGNHERYVAHYGNPDAPELLEDRFKPVAWSAGQFSDAERAGLMDAPLEHYFPEHPELLFVHASRQSDRGNVTPFMPDAEVAAMFASDIFPKRPKLIIRGHNHLVATQVIARGELAGTTLVTVGAVGLSLGGIPAAQYALVSRVHNDWQVDWQVQHRAVPYDVEATLRRFRDSGYLEAAGGAARLLMREVATGSHQLVPFLRDLDRWTCAGQVPFDEAVERFLNAY